MKWSLTEDGDFREDCFTAGLMTKASLGKVRLSQLFVHMVVMLPSVLRTISVAVVSTPARA